MNEPIFRPEWIERVRRPSARGELGSMTIVPLGYDWSPMTVSKALRVGAWGDRPRRHGWYPAKPAGWLP